MKLIVGLGNTGTKYVNTRHNIGFMAVEGIARSYNATEFRASAKFFAEICTYEDSEVKVIFAKPTTMMNLSGKSVKTIAGFYKIIPEDIVVLYDDVDLDFGQIRIREKGSSSGHRGVESVIEHIGPNFKRVKIGIGDNRTVGLASEDYVLQPFSDNETKALGAIIDNAVETTKQLIESGNTI